MYIFHIVGLNGTGKSTLAAAMVAMYGAKGAKCVVVDVIDMECLYQGSSERAVADHAEAEFLFLEHYPHNFQYPLPGSRVFRIENVPELAVAGVA